MAVFSINVPGTGDVTMSPGDTLQITFMEPCVFCFTPSDADYFTKPLPASGEQEPGPPWGAEARETTDPVTLEIWHNAVGGNCQSAPDGKRSIHIGNNPR